MKFNFKVNEQTGLPQAQFSALLKSVGTTELTNVNGKKYKVVSIEFENANGTKQLAAAAIYESNYSKGIEVGKTYLTTVTISEGKAWLQMSHLENAAQATADDFGFVATEIGVTPNTPVIGETV
jgi:hypothetical protein